MILKIDLILNKHYNIFIILKLNQNLEMNLIFKKELYQEKVLLELLKIVKVKLIINNMQLNMLNNQKVILILMNCKLDNKLNK